MYKSFFFFDKLNFNCSSLLCAGAMYLMNIHNVLEFGYFLHSVYHWNLMQVEQEWNEVAKKKYLYQNRNNYDNVENAFALKICN